MKVVFDSTIHLFAIFDKVLPILDSCLQFNFNYNGFMSDMFIVFSLALHAVKLFTCIFASFHITKVCSFIASITVAFNIVIESPCVESGWSVFRIAVLNHLYLLILGRKKFLMSVCVWEVVSINYFIGRRRSLNSAIY